MRNKNPITSKESASEDASPKDTKSSRNFGSLTEESTELVDIMKERRIKTCLQEN